jgi:hypothetical protein
VDQNELLAKTPAEVEPPLASVEQGHAAGGESSDDPDVPGRLGLANEPVPVEDADGSATGDPGEAGDHVDAVRRGMETLLEFFSRDPVEIAKFLDGTMGNRHERKLDRKRLSFEQHNAEAERELRRELHESESRRVSAEREARDAHLEAQRRFEESLQRFESHRAAWLDRVRSLVLVLVVLAIVCMPIVAMAIDIEPEEFLQYVAPVTAMTGTILGYWFGRHEPLTATAPRRRFVVDGDERITETIG